MNSIKKNINCKIYGLGVIIDKEKPNSILNIQSIILKSRGFSFLPSMSVVELTLKMIFSALRIKPDVVHCHDTLVLPLGVIVKFFTGAKLIYDAHELESNRNGLSRTLGKMTFFVEKLLWKSIDALIVVSPSIEKWYNRAIGDKYTKVILNAPILSEDNVNYNVNYLRDKFSIKEKSKIFLYIGILARGRGIELITEVFKNKDINSSLVFLGYGELSVDLKELSSQYNNIYIHDAVPHDEVVPIAKSADIGLCLIQNVSLSDYYCLPNKLFEYRYQY